MEHLALRKLYYQGEDIYRKAYHERFNSPSAVHLDFMISGQEAFFVETSDMAHMMYSILRLDKDIAAQCQRLPGKAMEQYFQKCLMDEIVASNKIEGVPCSREEVKAALAVLKEQSNGKGGETRFLGMVNRYEKLLAWAQVPLETCSDIRCIYDELVLKEVVYEDANNMPDGKIFRRDQTTVRSATDRVIHKGITPENKIIEAMEQALLFLHNDAIEPIYRICLFHYMIGYIHPFYDGNGRLGRFIFSYGIAEYLTPLLAVRISETIQENIGRYYKAFETCDDPHNLGELTPFLEMMLDVIEKATVDLKESLNR